MLLRTSLFYRFAGILESGASNLLMDLEQMMKFTRAQRLPVPRNPAPPSKYKSLSPITFLCWKQDIGWNTESLKKKLSSYAQKKKNKIGGDCSQANKSYTLTPEGDAGVRRAAFEHNR